MYLERLTVDGIDSNNNPNKYYRPLGEFNTYPAWSNINLPNCTMYCYCRMFEAINASKPLNFIRVDGGFGNAKTWYDTTTLPKGQELKEGSIAVFDGQYGHVAFVERVIDSTHALVSESQYDSNKSLRNYKYWQKRVIELVVGESTLSGIGPLIGFIYLPINDIRVNKRDVTKDQVKIKEELVRIRKSPNGEAYDGLFCPMGLYNVIKFEDKGDYKWAQLDNECWIAIYDIKNNQDVSWADVLIADSKEDETVVELKKKIKILEKENKDLNNKLLKVKKDLENVINEI